MAILFALAGLFWNPFLLLIALFVWLGASQEASMVHMRAALAGIPVMRAMVTKFHALRPDDPLSRALEFGLSGFQQDFPVIEGDRLVGVLTRNDLTNGLARLGAQGRVAEVMQRDFVTADPREKLPTAFMKLQECNCHTLPVVHNGHLLGVLTADHLAEVLMINEALREAKDQHRAPPIAARGRDGVPLVQGEGALADGGRRAERMDAWSAKGVSQT
jgi:CBS domain-containing protein